MLSEIGSNFWISPNELYEDSSDLNVSEFGIKCLDSVWLSSCRKAISLAIENIEINTLEQKKTVILPSYTCETVLEPFVQHGYKLVYLPINENLETNSHEILSVCKNNPGAILFIHRYFGFETLPNFERVLEEIKSLRITIIEDRTQCLYSGIEPIEADYFVGSIRKWCGVPDGGFLASRKRKIHIKPCLHDSKLEKLKIEAGISKYRYIIKGIGKKQTFLSLFGEAETILDNETEYYAISPSSKCIQRNLDIKLMKEIRRKNFIYVKERITKKIPDMKFIDEVTPLYFPIYVNDRVGLQKKLRDNAIYTPIIWPKAEIMGDMCCEKLYKNLLCLPIDQRYGRDDMERMVTLVNIYLD